MKIVNTPVLKMLGSPEINYIFNKQDGTMMTWGKTTKDNPEYSPYGPLILDCEISTTCTHWCQHCYKSNTANGRNMSFDTFKQILDKIPNTLTQIALGIGDIDANPELELILQYIRSKGIVPNITINGFRMTDQYYNMLAKYCGAIAVSYYGFHSCTYSVKQLKKVGLKFVNIHALLSEETAIDCINALEAQEESGANAVVFLTLKQKGRGYSYHPISQRRYDILLDLALSQKQSIGFDSCGAPRFLDYLRRHNKLTRELEILIEPCESTLQSYYCNVDSLGFGCSFTEGLPDYKGVDILHCNDFLKDVWFHPETVKFREKCLGSRDSSGCRKCCIYDI